MMIAGSMYPIAWFGFACQDFWKFFYIACITLFAALSLFVSVLSFFQTQRFLFFRIGMHRFCFDNEAILMLVMMVLDMMHCS